MRNKFIYILTVFILLFSFGNVYAADSYTVAGEITPYLRDGSAGRNKEVKVTIYEDKFCIQLRGSAEKCAGKSETISITETISNQECTFKFYLDTSVLISNLINSTDPIYLISENSARSLGINTIRISTNGISSSNETSTTTNTITSNSSNSSRSNTSNSNSSSSSNTGNTSNTSSGITNAAINAINNAVNNENSGGVTQSCTYYNSVYHSTGYLYRGSVASNQGRFSDENGTDYTVAIPAGIGNTCPIAIRVNDDGTATILDNRETDIKVYVRNDQEGTEWVTSQTSVTIPARNNGDAPGGASLSISCSEEGFRNILSFIKTIYTFIKYVAPVVLIIMGSLDFFKSTMASSESDMDKNKKRFINRIIIAIALFLLFSIFQLVFNLLEYAGVANSDSWISCWNSL